MILLILFVLHDFLLTQQFLYWYQPYSSFNVIWLCFIIIQFQFLLIFAESENSEIMICSFSSRENTFIFPWGVQFPLKFSAPFYEILSGKFFRFDFTLYLDKISQESFLVVSSEDAVGEVFCFQGCNVHKEFFNLIRLFCR